MFKRLNVYFIAIAKDVKLPCLCVVLLGRLDGNCNNITSTGLRSALGLDNRDICKMIRLNKQSNNDNCMDRL